MVESEGARILKDNDDDVRDGRHAIESHQVNTQPRAVRLGPSPSHHSGHYVISSHLSKIWTWTYRIVHRLKASCEQEAQRCRHRAMVHDSM